MNKHECCDDSKILTYIGQCPVFEDCGFYINIGIVFEKDMYPFKLIYCPWCGDKLDEIKEDSCETNT